MTEQTVATPALSEFLLARIEEDEASARRLSTVVAGIDVPHITTDLQIVTDHLDVLVQPRRVLADCEAKRQIVLSAQDAMRAADNLPADASEVRSEAVGAGANVYEYVLRMLAEPYANHPDFQTEWLAI